MFLFYFNVVKPEWSACQSKTKAEKAQATVLSGGMNASCAFCMNTFLVLFFSCPYSLFHFRWKSFLKTQQPRGDFSV